MSKNITLVILAAGMGSRFGGLKQIEPIGPNGEFIIDYSIYDAISAGFNKVVFIIKKENYDIFKKTIGLRVESHVKTEYVFQENDNLPIKNEVLENRNKPLGTAHAILCCKDIVKEPFMIINADDFYGKDAFVKGADFLRNRVDSDNYGLISYQTKNTITDTGVLKRGICKSSDGYLKKIIESKVHFENDRIYAEPLDERIKPFYVDDDAEVSMNMLLFDPSIFSFIESKFPIFINNNLNKLEECEFLIPEVLFEAIEDGYARCEVIKTDATWYGVTYREELEDVKKSIKKLVDDKVYPNNLW